MTSTSGCSQSSSLKTSPFVNSVSERGSSEPLPSANPNLLNTTAKQYQVSFSKAALLGRSFVYNLDLQYSSQFDSEDDLYNPSAVAASVPALFQISVDGTTLELIQDARDKFPSDVNHPGDLIARFKILSQDDHDIVVADADSASYLAEQLGPADSSDKRLGYLDRWTRSAELAENGALYLQQTSIKAQDGTIAEFMESIFPRDRLAAGNQFQKIKMNPDDPVGVFSDPSQGPENTIVGRYRFLNGDTVFTGEDKHAFAQHYDLTPRADGTPATIDWYVTPNAPDAVLSDLKVAVEGWNRYFRKMKGIERDVLQFKGKLPEGIYVGDPRYNVICWDSRRVAGAAYETQGSDPDTGKQSHSLIYMPAAWLQLGADYWTQGQSSEGSAGDPSPPAERGSSILKTKISKRSACSRDLRGALAVVRSGRMTGDEIDQFSHQLLKQTLFHEVGHSLGFAHNFEGSTEWDPSKAGSPFSSSIMDYNDFEIERAAFASVDSSDGPLLEYDRQVLSAIYNRSQDIAPNDRWMPACNDAEADNEKGGVIPICIRYDLEHDPTLSVQRAVDRIQESTLAGDITLEQAIARVPSLFATDARIAQVKTQADIDPFVTDLSNALTGSLIYYVGNSRASLGYTVRLNLKSLLEFSPDALPKDGNYNPDDMRERAFAGVHAMTGLLDLPPNVKSALDHALNAGVARLGNSPYAIGMASSAKAGVLENVTNLVSNNIKRFVTDPTDAQGLIAMRVKVIKALNRHTDDPFYFGPAANGASANYEQAIVGILADIVSGSAKYTSLERIAAAKTLASYEGRPAFSGAADALQKSLQAEEAAATDNASLETVLSILSALNGS